MINRLSLAMRRWLSKAEEQAELLSGLEGVKRNVSGLYAIMFTCNKCSTRSTKTFSKDSYHNGVVIVRCGGCASHHLVADNLGWFRDSKTSIEDIMREKGQQVTRVEGLNEVLEFFKR